MEQPKHQIVAKTFLNNPHAILLFWTLEDGQVFWRYADQKVAHEIPEFGVSIDKITKQLVITHIVPEDACRSTIRKESFPILLLSKEDTKHEIAKTEQFIERGPEYQVRYLVGLERERFLYVAFSKTNPGLAKAFVIEGSPASQNTRRDIYNVRSEVMADGGTTAVFTEDVDESDEISGITLCLDIPSSLSDDKPSLILDGQVERSVVVYNNGDPKLMEFELLELLSNEEKRGTAQFADRHGVLLV